jgi:hypothetical protein
MKKTTKEWLQRGSRKVRARVVWGSAVGCRVAAGGRERVARGSTLGTDTATLRSERDTAAHGVPRFEQDASCFATPPDA